MTVSMFSIVVLPLTFRGSASTPEVTNREVTETRVGDSDHDNFRVRNVTLAVPLGCSMKKKYPGAAQFFYRELAKYEGKVRRAANDPAELRFYKGEIAEANLIHVENLSKDTSREQIVEILQMKGIQPTKFQGKRA